MHTQACASRAASRRRRHTFRPRGNSRHQARLRRLAAGRSHTCRRLLGRVAGRGPGRRPRRGSAAAADRAECPRGHHPGAPSRHSRRRRGSAGAGEECLQLGMSTSDWQPPPRMNACTSARRRGPAGRPAASIAPPRPATSSQLAALCRTKPPHPGPPWPPCRPQAWQLTWQTWPSGRACWSTARRSCSETCFRVSRRRAAWPAALSWSACSHGCCTTSCPACLQRCGGIRGLRVCGGGGGATSSLGAPLRLARCPRPRPRPRPRRT